MTSSFQEVQVHLLTLDRYCRDNDIALNTSYKPDRLPMVRGYEWAEHLRPQGLYITAEVTPKVGEWGFKDDKCVLVHRETPKEVVMGLRKIIGSKDTNLNLLGVPQISDIFIRKYMHSYNKGHVITKAWTILLSRSRSVTTGDGSYSTEIFRTEQLDDEGRLQVVDRGSKESYSRKEMLELLQKAYLFGYVDRDANLPAFSGIAPLDYIEKKLGPQI